MRTSSTARGATPFLRLLTAGAVIAVGALTTTALSTDEAQARAQSGVCEVYRNTTRIDSNSCLAREICYYNTKTRGESCKTEYLWPTNATTLVTYESGRPTLVNGAPAERRNIRGMNCALNKVTGNTFCYRRR